MKSKKSTVESSSAGLQKELSNRFNLTHTLTQKIRRKQPTTKTTGRTRNSTLLEREQRGPLRRNNSTVSSTTPAAARLPLNSIDWKQKEAIALTRAGLTQSCAICHETYQYSYSSTKHINTKSSNSNSNSIMHVKTNKRRGSQSQSQTILCCSHVFHTNCLASFERFVGFENRFCPLCRGGVGCYSKMLTNVGSLAREQNAVVIVQKVVRGYIVRKEFRCRLRSYYAHHALCGDKYEDEDKNKNEDKNNNEEKKEDGMIILKNIRQKFYVKELEHLGGKMQKQIECNGNNLKQLEEKIDKSLGASRELDEMLAADSNTGATFASSVASNVKWDIVMKAAFERGDEAGTGTGTGRCNDNNASDYEKQNKNTCAICMSIMDHQHRRNVTLLSCSHLFCTSCIESFETFNAHRVDMNAHACVCPVCRSSYEKLQVIL